MGNEEDKDPEKTGLWDKIVNKNNFPTAYALFAAIGLITTLADGGRLAKKLIDSFDALIQTVAGFISSFLLPFWETQLIVELLYLSGLIYFAIVGFVDLFRRREVFQRSWDIYFSCICTFFIFLLWAMKFGRSEITAPFILMAIMSSVLTGSFAFLAYFVLKLLLRKWNDTVLYVLAMVICIAGIAVYALKTQVYSLGGMSLVYEVLPIYGIVSICILLLSLNPKSVRQITFLIGLLLVLSYVSIPLDRLVG